MSSKRSRSISKSHYTVDEMIERAKDVQAAKEGRSRRRRSDQPKRKKQSKAVKFLIGTGITLLVVLAVLGVISKINQIRYRSPEFRNDVSARLGDLLGLDVNLSSELSVDSGSLTLKEATASGGENSAVRDLHAWGLTAEMNLPSFFGDAWQVATLSLFDMDLYLKVPRGASSSADVPASTGGRRGFLSLSSSPSVIELMNLRVADFDLFFGESELSNRIKETSLSAEIFGDDVNFRGVNGKFFWGPPPGFSAPQFQRLRPAGEN